MGLSCRTYAKLFANICRMTIVFTALWTDEKGHHETLQILTLTLVLTPTLTYAVDSKISVSLADHVTITVVAHIFSEKRFNPRHVK